MGGIPGEGVSARREEAGATGTFDPHSRRRQEVWARVSHRAPQGQMRSEADPAGHSGHERPRRAMGQVHQARVPEPFHLLQRRAPGLSGRAVPEALPHRATAPGHRQPIDHLIPALTPKTW